MNDDRKIVMILDAAFDLGQVGSFLPRQVREYEEHFIEIADNHGAEVILQSYEWEHPEYYDPNDLWQDIHDMIDLPDTSDMIKEIEDMTGVWTGVDWCSPSTGEVYLYQDPEDPDEVATLVTIEFDSECLDGDEDIDEMVDNWFTTFDISLYPDTEIERLRKTVYTTAEQAVVYAKDVIGYAELANKCGKRAIELLENDFWADAKEEIENAVNYETEFGDSPVWGPVLKLFEELIEI